MSRKLLVIDDDLELLSLLQRGLAQEGFAVVTAQSGKQGFEKAYRTHPDVILLDIVLPKVDGWVTLQQLRRICDAPIVVFSAKASLEDVRKAGSLGAADYITKPCRLKELAYRVEQVLVHHERREPCVVFDDGRLRIDSVRGVDVRRRQGIELSPTESRLLTYLARRRGQTIPYRELLVNVWGPEFATEIGYLATYVRYLSQKIEDDPAHPRYIHSHHRVGYSFMDETA